MSTHSPRRPILFLLAALTLLAGLPAGAQPAPRLEPVPSDSVPPPPAYPPPVYPPPAYPPPAYPPPGEPPPAYPPPRRYPPPPPVVPRRPRDAPIRRFYLKLRPFVGLATYNVTDQNVRAGGVLLDLGIEYNSAHGLWVGLEAAPIAFTNLYYGIPFASGRLALGYSSKYWGLAVGLGSGVGSYFNLGPIVRVGSFEGTYARLRIAFSVFLPFRFPTNGALEVNIKLLPRLRLALEVGGDFIIQGLYSNAGVQILFRGKGGPGTHILTVGGGVSGVLLTPGPMVTIGYERRW
jgi:hypothetical protein